MKKRREKRTKKQLRAETALVLNYLFTFRVFVENIVLKRALNVLTQLNKQTQQELEQCHFCNQQLSFMSLAHGHTFPYISDRDW